MRKNWVFGFFGFFALFALPDLLRGNWERGVWLVWLVWFVYFIPQKAQQRSGAGSSKKRDAST